MLNRIKFIKYQIVLIIIYFSTVILCAVPLMVPNWTHLKWHKNYPLYEVISQEKLTSAERINYYNKTYQYSPKIETDYTIRMEKIRDQKTGMMKKYVTLVDSSGIECWTKYSESEHPQLYVAQNNISVFTSYDNWNSVVWFDKKGNELNRINFDNDEIIARARPLKNGEYWIITTDFDNNFEIQSNNKNLLSLIFTDKFGNILNKINLKYPNYGTYSTISRSEEYLMMSCTEGQAGKRDYKYYSYFLKANGTIVKEYNKLISRGYFSDNETIYISNGKIMDVSTGEFITSFISHGSCKSANKGIPVFVSSEGNVLRIVDYEKKELLFYKEFKYGEKPCEIEYVEISGDGKTIKALARGRLYKFELIKNKRE